MIAALAVLLLPLWTKAQFNISGSVSENEQHLPGASIRIKNAGLGTTANKQGQYQFKNVKAGSYTLEVSFMGYQTQVKNITLNADVVLNFNLKASAYLADEVIVRGTRANEKSATTYKNLSKAEISENNFGQDLPFLLNNTPGVVVSSDAGAGIGYTSMTIRGSDASRINVTVNGIPYNDSESQGSFWVNMPDFASSVENIQIQRGVGTSTNGAGAFGGSINVQTSAIAAEPFAEINNSAGSFGTLKNTVKLGSGLINGKFSFDGRLSQIKTDGFVDRGSADLKSYFLSGAYQGKKDLLRLNVFAGAEKTYQAWNGIPEARLNGDVAGMQAYIDRNYLSEADAQLLLNSNSRTYNSFTYKDQTDNYWQNHYQLLYARQFTDKFSFNGALHYTDGRGYYEEFKEDQKLASYGLAPVGTGTTAITKTDLIRRRWLDNDFYGVTYNFVYQPQANLSFTLGGAYNEYKGKHFGEIIWAQYAANGNYGDHYYDNEGDKTDFNVYGKVSYSPTEKVSLFADLQYRSINYAVLGTENKLNFLDLQDKMDFFNPKVGATFFVNDKSNVYLSLSVANKEPKRDDYVSANPGLFPRPERLYNTELGYRINSGNLNAGVNAYGMFYKDQLVVTGKINDVGASMRQNVEDSYRIGVELDAAYTLSSKLILNANAAFSKNKISNYVDYLYEYDDDGNITNTVETNYKSTAISFSPSAVLFAELAYQPFTGFAIALQNKYVSKQYLDNTQEETRKLKGYFVSNLRTGYDFTAFGIKKVNLGLLVNNVFNKKYESNGYTYGSIYQGVTTRENFYFPQAGTNFLLSLNLKF
ncbi:TonB-dependent receptor [Pedobacter sp.]|uniref:TonB-dependent receptor n=1 Tax=Pedobacter sp. TaxID=1411316 RepID=UPI003D7F3588